MKAFLLWTHIVVKLSSRRLADDAKKNAKKCAPHAQHDDFFLWFDQSYDRFVTMQREACNVIKYADIGRWCRPRLRPHYVSTILAISLSVRMCPKKLSITEILGEYL